MIGRAEEIARRRTADDVTVQFWSDGAVTYSFARIPVRGAGVARSNYERKKNVDANWLLAGEIGLYDARELPAAVQAARKVVRSYGSHEALAAFRRAMNRASTPRRDNGRRRKMTRPTRRTRWIYVEDLRPGNVILAEVGPLEVLSAPEPYTRDVGGFTRHMVGFRVRNLDTGDESTAGYQAESTVPTRA